MDLDGVEPLAVPTDADNFGRLDEIAGYYSSRRFFIGLVPVSRPVSSMSSQGERRKSYLIASLTRFKSCMHLIIIGIDDAW